MGFEINQYSLTIVYINLKLYFKLMLFFLFINFLINIFFQYFSKLFNMLNKEYSFKLLSFIKYLAS